MSNYSNSTMNKIRKFAGAKKRAWKKLVNTGLHLDAKGYYRSYIANNVISPLNEQLVSDALSYNPKSVFEFGCGLGKNLQLLKKEVPKHLGIDISSKAVEIALSNNLNVICGDETMLATIMNHDIVLTCSVLDHIEHIDAIVAELKRIANFAIIIAETNMKVARFYYPHDYESMGFVKTGFAYTSYQAKKEAVYYIWHYVK